MAYATAHLRQIQSTQGEGPAFTTWAYDTVDSNSDVYAIGYISDAKAKGMLKGDVVYVRIWTTAVPTATSELQAADGAGNDLVAIYIHFVIGISATTGAADLTNGLAITATNS